MIYHVSLGGRRTTVSLHETLSELLALKLGFEPDGKEAHGAVRRWLQARLDAADDPERVLTSQWLQACAIRAIAGPELAESWGRWMDKKLSKKRTGTDASGAP
jgi:hypothetical protein